MQKFLSEIRRRTQIIHGFAAATVSSSTRQRSCLALEVKVADGVVPLSDLVLSVVVKTAPTEAKALSRKYQDQDQDFIYIMKKNNEE